MAVGFRSTTEAGLSGDRAPFVGRASELSALRARFDDGERLVTVLGPPGVGKTRLARQFAAEATVPALLVDLAQARTRTDLEQRLLATLGVPVGDADGAERLGDAVAARDELLLVLDNCEYLDRDARALLDRLYDRAPLVRMLATSLVPLELEGELCFALAPLDCDAAVALYEEQARRLDPSAPLDREAIETLVERLDRNPLAIRLAAARVRTLRPKQLLARIDQRLTLLRGGAPGRHSSLRDAIGHAWELLTPCEAAALAQCAVFAGGFTLEAAEAVLDLSAFPEAPPIVGVIDQLRGKVLLAADDADPPRFLLLESIRAYALGELERMGSTEAAFARHASYFAGIGDHEPGDLLSTDARRRLLPEEENLRAAFQRANPGEPTMAARLGLALEPLVLRHGYRHAAQHLRATVAAARASSDPALHCRALYALALVEIQLAEVHEGRAHLDEALRLAHDAGSPRLACAIRIALARFRVFGRAPEVTFAELDACLLEARSLGVAPLEALAEHALGFAYSGIGHSSEAAHHCERAALLFERIGLDRHAALALAHLGVHRARLGEIAGARRVLERALSLARETGDRTVESHTLVNLGSIALCEGELDHAEQVLAGLCALERFLGRPQYEAAAAFNLALVSFERGDLRSARPLVDDALVVLRISENRRYMGNLHAFHGALLAEMGEIPRARQAFGEARGLVEPLGDTETLRMFDVLDGFLELAEARAPEAASDALLAAARARAAAGLEGTPSATRLIAVRLLNAALARWHEAAAPTNSGAPAGPALRIGAGALWFEAPGAARVDLRRRRPIRLVLNGLVEQRLRAPGVGIGVDEIFAAGWPGERALPSAAAARVYDAIRVLRQGGLESILVRHDDGYRLDPATPIRRELD